jgi:hypothetical protein
VNTGEDNLKFWDEIYGYITNHYELESVKKIYLNADGGGSIKAGMKRLEEYLESETGVKKIREAREYILSNWTAAKLRINHQDGLKGSSTEGHVSHVLSSRMSSRPMGWSRKGAGKMAQLRAYYLNGGDMLELVRYQKKEQPKAVED